MKVTKCGKLFCNEIMLLKKKKINIIFDFLFFSLNIDVHIFYFWTQIALRVDE